MNKKSKTTTNSGTNQNISIVFFGNEKLVTGGGAQPVIRESLLAAGFEIEKAITGSLSELGQHESTVAVLAAYGHIIPQRILDEFPDGIINIHPSLLPKYRGPTPIESAILQGDTKTGVSVMRLTAGMDEGPIYVQRSIPLTGTETKQALAEKLQTLGAELLVETLPGIVSGALKSRQQPHPDRATYSRKLTKDDGELDFSKSAEQLEREIRAFSDWPKSRTTLGDIEAVITRASVVRVQGKPGAYTTENKQLIIYCGHDALSIDRLKPTGKQEMSAEGFLAGYKNRL